MSQDIFQNLATERSLSDTGKKGVLVFECRARRGDFAENVQVHTGKIRGILPRCPDLALQETCRSERWLSWQPEGARIEKTSGDDE